MLAAPRGPLPTITWGLLSPFVAALYFAPFAGHWPFVAILTAWYVAFPVGIACGTVVGLALRWQCERGAVYFADSRCLK